MFFKSNLKNAFKALDINEDGEVSKEESIRGYMLYYNFKKLDVDDNDLLNRMELNNLEQWSQITKMYFTYNLDSIMNMIIFVEYMSY